MRHFLPAVLFALIVSVVHSQEPEPPEPVGPPPESDFKGGVFLTFNAPGHVGHVRGLAFSPDGSRLYSVGDDKTVQVWDTKSGERIQVIRVPVGPDDTGALTGVAASPDGKTLALRNRELHEAIRKNSLGTVQLLNLDDGRVAWLKPVEADPEAHIAFSADGDRVAAGAFVWSGLKKIWDMPLEKVQALAPLMLSSPKRTRVRQPFNPAFSPDSRQLLLVRPDVTTGPTGAGWNLESVAGKESKPDFHLRHKGRSVTAVGWDAAGRAITGDEPASGSPDDHHFLHLWSSAGSEIGRADVKDLHLPAALQKKQFHPSYIAAFPKSETKNEILVQGRVGTATVTAVIDFAAPEAARGRAGLVLEGNPIDIDPVGALAPDGKQAACLAGLAQNQIVLWDTTTGKEVHRLGGSVWTPLDLRWSTKGQTLCWQTAGESQGSEEKPEKRDEPKKGKGGKKAGRAAGPQVARVGSFGFDLDELQLSEIELKQRGDPEKFIGPRVSAGKWSVAEKAERDGTGGTSHHLVITGPTTVGKTKLIPPWGPVITKFSLQGRENPSWLAWGTTGTLHLSDATDGKPIHELVPVRQNVQSVVSSPDGRYFAATGDGQTVRIYSPKQRQPLLEILHTEDDWIAWTRSGYYAASLEGERLIGWTLNNGYDHVATFHPASRLRSRFYRPDVIQLVLEKGDVAEALKAADEKAGKKVDVGVAADPNALLPPHVTLKADLAKAPEQVTVKATAEAKSDKQPLSSLQLLLDGRPAPVEKETVTLAAPLAPGKKVNQEWVVKLPPGKHQLAVRARGNDTLAVSDPVEVEGPKPPLQASARLHILVAGVAKYANDGKGAENDSLNLKYAVKDAEEIQSVLLQRCADGRLFSPGRKQKLVNEEATTKRLEEELKALAADTSIKSSDLVIFYFSGHGEKDEAGKLFLLTHTADRSKPLAETCLSGEKLKELLAAIPCRVLMLLDACHSTAIGPKTRPATDDLTRRLIDEDCQVAVMTAAMGKEFALEGMKDEKGKEIENGLFTRALIEALAGRAKGDDEGLVFVHRVYDDVFERVRLWSAKRQNPFIALPWNVRPFPVVRRAANPATEK